jgi:hypothetical protein
LVHESSSTEELFPLFPGQYLGYPYVAAYLHQQQQQLAAATAVPHQLLGPALSSLAGTALTSPQTTVPFYSAVATTGLSPLTMSAVSKPDTSSSATAVSQQ